MKCENMFAVLKRDDGLLVLANVKFTMNDFIPLQRFASSNGDEWPPRSSVKEQLLRLSARIRPLQWSFLLHHTDAKKTARPYAPSGKISLTNQ